MYKPTKLYKIVPVPPALMIGLPAKAFQEIKFEKPIRYVKPVKEANGIHA